MITLQEAVRSLYGAYRLARFDPSGMGFMNASVKGFWNSFFAAAAVLPFFLMLLVVDYLLERSDDPLRFASIQSIGYVIGWVLFPLVMTGVVRSLGRERHYLGYVVAYNWCAVVQNALYTPAALLVASEGSGFSPTSLLAIAVMAFVLVYSWFVARTALEIPGRMAALIVLLDLSLSIFLSTVTDSLIGGNVAIDPPPPMMSAPAQTVG